METVLNYIRQHFTETKQKLNRSRDCLFFRRNYVLTLILYYDVQDSVFYALRILNNCISFGRGGTLVIGK